MTDLPTRLAQALKFNQESFNKIYKSEVDEIFTYMDVREGALVENARLAPLHRALVEIVRAAKKLGLRCVNTGNYGPMNIRPGECVCSTCAMKQALASLDAAIKQTEMK